LKQNFPFRAVSRARYDLVDIVGEGEHFPPSELYLIAFSQYVLMFQNLEGIERRKKSLQMAMTPPVVMVWWQASIGYVRLNSGIEPFKRVECRCPLFPSNCHEHFEKQGNSKRVMD
jgi:hypothetical protein